MCEPDSQYQLLHGNKRSKYFRREKWRQCWKMSGIRVALASCLAVLLLGGGCHRAYQKPTLPVSPTDLKPVRELPEFNDDLDGADLAEALRMQISALRGRDLNQPVVFGGMTVPRRRILATVERFAAILESEGLGKLAQSIGQEFEVFQSVGANSQGEVLFTGYFQPVLEGRRSAEGEFQYPLFRTPEDLQVLDLGTIDPKYAGGKIALRVDEGVIKPYFDREAIDGQGVLNGRGLELVYLKDYFERYLLQVQGSGVVILENGERMGVCYAASNGYPYVSLGRLLGEEGKLRPEDLSLERIRKHLEQEPEKMRTLLNRNRRYIFFGECTGQVCGSEGVPLTPRRSIATDKRVFPGGGLAFVVSKRPFPGSRKDKEHRVVRGRFVLDQDTGDAMRGPGRVDLFWGTGKEAEKIAGTFKQTGTLYYLLVKE